MGHGSSKPDLDDSSKGSYYRRVRNRVGSHCRRRSGSSSRSKSKSPPSKLKFPTKHVTVEDFAGIALVQIIKAEMKFEDRWFACISLGERTFRTSTSDETDRPVWESKKKLLLERNGPHIARISVFETNRVSKNNLIGYCEVDLLEAITGESDSKLKELKLLDPTFNTHVGNISISCSIEDPLDTEKSFAMRILSIVDYNQDKKLSRSEFYALIGAFGNQVAAKKQGELFDTADKNNDGYVSMDELANLLAIQHEKEPLINNCPVCGETLGISDRLNDMIHLTLCFDEGTGNQVMTGGFLTDKQAAYGWMFKLTEWAKLSSYEIGLRSGSNASHILIVDRKTKRVVEELVDAKVMLSIRAIYQSKVGLCFMDMGGKEILQSISQNHGNRMSLPESAKDIPKFIETYQGQINMAEIKYPIEHFKTFNEFFIRELKPGARPIASKEREDVAVCACDSRLMAFKSATDSLRFWIKGRKFSMNGLLGGESSSAFVEGSLVIFRLAPQDYHHFHAPVSGTIEKIISISGSLYTVNPIAVNSKYCNVFTENKRDIAIISTANYGKVALVAVGATMVGGIIFTKKVGDSVQKGDELGYFLFGGSTVICIFEKDAFDLDEDLLANSARSLETLVSVGMTLGVFRKKENKIGIPGMDAC